MKRARLLVFTILAACGQAPETDRLPADSAVAPAEAPPTAPPADSGAPRLMPTDEADSSFRAFRERALHALARRDTAFLYRILAPTIKNSFGGDDSIAGFRRIWLMAQPDNSAVWASLSRVLRMGGKQADSTFIAPYVYWFWPDKIDAFEHVAVTSRRAPVYAEPDARAEVIGTASYSILKVDEWRGMGESFVATDTSWARVQLPDGRPAWLHARDVYSPVSWRAFFTRRGDSWLMTLFVAGD